MWSAFCESFLIPESKILLADLTRQNEQIKSERDRILVIDRQYLTTGQAQQAGLIIYESLRARRLAHLPICQIIEAKTENIMEANIQAILKRIWGHYMYDLKEASPGDRFDDTIFDVMSLRQVTACKLYDRHLANRRSENRSYLLLEALCDCANGKLTINNTQLSQSVINNSYAISPYSWMRNSLSIYIEETTKNIAKNTETYQKHQAKREQLQQIEQVCLPRLAHTLRETDELHIDIDIEDFDAMSRIVSALSEKKLKYLKQLDDEVDPDTILKSVETDEKETRRLAAAAAVVSTGELEHVGNKYNALATAHWQSGRKQQLQHHRVILVNCLECTPDALMTQSLRDVLRDTRKEIAAYDKVQETKAIDTVEKLTNEYNVLHKDYLQRALQQDVLDHFITMCGVMSEKLKARPGRLAWTSNAHDAWQQKFRDYLTDAVVIDEETLHHLREACDREDEMRQMKDTSIRNTFDPINVKYIQGTGHWRKVLLALQARLKSNVTSISDAFERDCVFAFTALSTDDQAPVEWLFACVDRHRAVIEQCVNIESSRADIVRYQKEIELLLDDGNDKTVAFSVLQRLMEMLCWFQTQFNDALSGDTETH